VNTRCKATVWISGIKIRVPNSIGEEEEEEEGCGTRQEGRRRRSTT